MPPLREPFRGDFPYLIGCPTPCLHKKHPTPGRADSQPAALRHLTFGVPGRLSYVQVARVELIGVASQPGAAPFDEAALIRAAQQRDHDAFERLVRLHERSVLRLATNILRSEEDARDAYQEAFLRAYRRLESFSFQSSFHTWIYRIVTNVCLDILRRRGVRKEQTVKEEAESGSPTVFDKTADERAEADPDRVLTGRQLAASIDLALLELSPKERIVFEMKHYEGLRLRAIGEMLSISEEAAKNCLFRATRKLRKALKDVES